VKRRRWRCDHTPIPGDAVADAVEAAEFFDVDVEQLARLLALVAAHRLGRFERAQFVEAEPFEGAATLAGEMPSSAPICLPVQRRRRSSAMRSRVVPSKGRYLRGKRGDSDQVEGHQAGRRSRQRRCASGCRRWVLLAS
jgi:hypothetical protein